MKVVILAGGFGTRISEESHLKPKPMIEIGDKPVLWHIMKQFSAYGYNEFIICAGYKQEVIKQYFADYYLHQSDVTFDFTNNNELKIHHHTTEPWKVTVVDTGLNTMTGGRIKRIKEYVKGEAFLLTYGDGVSDININDLVKFHSAHENIVTMSAFNTKQRFGVLDIAQDGTIREFREKTQGDGNMINIGFMVCEPQLFDYIENDQTVLEKKPLENIAKEGKLVAYRHNGFWQCMDTLREKQELETMWESGNAPWKVWADESFIIDHES